MLKGMKSKLENERIKNKRKKNEQFEFTLVKLD